jgi:hypothetical protein
VISDERLSTLSSMLDQQVRNRNGQDSNLNFIRILIISTIFDLPNISGLTVSKLVERFFSILPRPNIRKLYLAFPYDSPKFPTYIPNYCSLTLEEIWIEDTSRSAKSIYDKNVIDMMKQCQKLRLIRANLLRLSTLESEEMRDFSPFPTAGLSFLGLHGSPISSSTWSSIITQYHSSLDTLIVSHGAWVKPAGSSSLLLPKGYSFQNLDSLSIRKCCHFHSEHLGNLLKLTPNLERLSFEELFDSIGQLVGVSFFEGIRRCTKLKSLKLGGLHFNESFIVIDDPTILSQIGGKFLADFGGPSELKILKLDNVLLPDRALEWFLRDQEHLKILEFYCCEELEFLDMLTSSRHNSLRLPSLTTLKFIGCGSLKLKGKGMRDPNLTPTMEFPPLLGPCLPQLTVLKVVGCRAMRLTHLSNFLLGNEWPKLQDIKYEPKIKSSAQAFRDQEDKIESIPQSLYESIKLCPCLVELDLPRWASFDQKIFDSILYCPYFSNKLTLSYPIHLEKLLVQLTKLLKLKSHHCQFEINAIKIDSNQFRDLRMGDLGAQFKELEELMTDAGLSLTFGDDSDGIWREVRFGASEYKYDMTRSQEFQSSEWTYDGESIDSDDRSNVSGYETSTEGGTDDTRSRRSMDWR